MEFDGIHRREPVFGLERESSVELAFEMSVRLKKYKCVVRTWYQEGRDFQDTEAVRTKTQDGQWGGGRGAGHGDRRSLDCVAKQGS